MKSVKHAKLGSAAAVLLAIASAGLGCESILGLTPGEGLCEDVICPAKDACHLQGTCDEGTGQCSSPIAMPKTPCDDGNACTTGDACQNGACVPGTPETCTLPMPCHKYAAGTCDPKSGCSYPALQDGTPCDDGSECTSGDTCQQGKCTGTPAAEGSPCGFGDSCTVAGTCTKGACTGKIESDGTACTDGTVCTSNDTCKGGICNPSVDHSWARWDMEVPPPPPSQRYDMTDTVVFDKVTHLTWERDPSVVNPSVTDMNWEKAKAFCVNLSIPGYPKGWRLPTRIELASIVDHTRSSPAFNIDFFGGPAGYYWTSSPRADINGQAWMISFNRGYVGTAVTTDTYHVRCVR